MRLPQYSIHMPNMMCRCMQVLCARSLQYHTLKIQRIFTGELCRVWSCFVCVARSPCPAVRYGTVHVLDYWYQCNGPTLMSYSEYCISYVGMYSEYDPTVVPNRNTVMTMMMTCVGSSFRFLLWDSTTYVRLPFFSFIFVFEPLTTFKLHKIDFQDGSRQQTHSSGARLQTQVGCQIVAQRKAFPIVSCRFRCPLCLSNHLGHVDDRTPISTIFGEGRSRRISRYVLFLLR